MTTNNLPHNDLPQYFIDNIRKYMIKGAPNSQHKDIEEYDRELLIQEFTHTYLDINEDTLFLICTLFKII